MKIAGIIILILGILSTFGAVVGTLYGRSGSFYGLGFVALGAFLIYRANKNKEDEDNKKNWDNGAKK